MADWFRWWHGTVNDPKFLWVAKRSGATVGQVVATWAALLETASSANETLETRGNVSRFDCVSFDCLFGFEDGLCQKIVSALGEKGMIDSDGFLARWLDRQPKREDGNTAASTARTSTERVRKFREKKRDETTETEVKRDETQKPDRGEERREDLPPPLGEPADGAFPMNLDWQPSPHFRSMAKQSMLPAPGSEKFTYLLAEFVSYWIARPDRLRTQAEWDNTLLKSLQRDKVTSAATPAKARTRESSISSAGQQTAEAGMRWLESQGGGE
jgi:hypothetical protein